MQARCEVLSLLALLRCEVLITSLTGTKIQRLTQKECGRSMLLGLLGEHAEVATLANSSALDERWQTDLPNFMHQWLRLLSVHQPSQMTRYISLVTQGTQVACLLVQSCTN